MYYFEVYEGHYTHSWYWRIRARNGRIVADGAEAYASAGNCHAAIKRLKKNLGMLDSVEVRVKK